MEVGSILTNFILFREDILWTIIAESPNLINDEYKYLIPMLGLFLL